jgi:hypothetical protein
MTEEHSLTEDDIETLFNDHLGEIWAYVCNWKEQAVELEQRVQYLEQMIVKIVSGNS